MKEHFNRQIQDTIENNQQFKITADPGWLNTKQMMLIYVLRTKSESRDKTEFNYRAVPFLYRPNDEINIPNMKFIQMTTAEPSFPIFEAI